MNKIENLFSKNPISPLREIAAYEMLWKRNGISFKKIADIFRDRPDLELSSIFSDDVLDEISALVKKELSKAGIEDKMKVMTNRMLDYPERLRDAKNPIEMIYYRGDWDLIEDPRTVSIVGSRNVSEDGIRRAKRLTRLLVERGYTIVSGLARGVDTVAHTTAIEMKGKTIAVIGTPITEYYPRENKELQDFIARKFLLISQVPILRYKNQDFRQNRFFFPERNATMSALTKATIIVEASETSGTLTQARAAIHQRRKLFILDSCFNNPRLTWPKYYEKLGAIRVKEINDILESLE